jgi:CBS domain-containing protein
MPAQNRICSAAHGGQILVLAVSSAMSKTVVACRQGGTVAAAGQRMQEHRVRRLAVVDGDAESARYVDVPGLSRLRAATAEPSPSS